MKEMQEIDRELTGLGGIRNNLLGPSLYVFPTSHGHVMSTQPFKNLNVLATTGIAYLLTRSEMYKRGIADHEMGWGLFSRREDVKQNTSIDDFLGVCMVPEFARRVVWRMRFSFGFWNVERPWLPFLPPKQWVFRFQGAYITAKMRAGMWVWPWEKWIWAFCVRRAAREPASNQDAHIQTQAMVIVYRESNLACSLMNRASLEWKQSLPKPIYEIAADYIGDPEHDLVRLLKNI